MKKLAIMLAFLLLPSVVLADNYCLDNETSLKIANYTFQTGTGITKNMTIEKPIDCPYGCDSVTGTCNSDPIWQELIVFISILVLIGVIWWLISKRRR